MNDTLADRVFTRLFWILVVTTLSLGALSYVF